MAIEPNFSSRVKTMKTSAVRDLFAAATNPDIISLAGGMPDITALPLDEVAACAARSIQEEGVSALQYGGTTGRVEMRQVAADLVKDWNIDVDPEEIILTSGSQLALDLIGKTFLDPGDVIIAEGPTYLGALQAFSAYEPVVHCIDFDDEGMRMDLLEEELKKLGKGGAKFIYTIPNFQNPGGVTMSMERRQRLLELSAEYNVPVVEDDPYGWLRYKGEPLPALRSMSDEVIYLGTISKIFAPGLRMAWVIAPKPILDKINLCKQGTDLCGSTYDQVFVEHYFHDTDWRATMATVNARYAERLEAMLTALDDFFPEYATWTKPDGGFFLWITLPENFNTKEMAKLAMDQGVLYVPGDSCYPDGRGFNSMRVAFCYESAADITEAIKRLAGVIAEYEKTL